MHATHLLLHLPASLLMAVCFVCCSAAAVAPPGHYLSAGVVTKCGTATYRVGFSNATACDACGAGLWLADENVYINQLDAYGAVRKSWATRGGPDSCCECGCVPVSQVHTVRPAPAAV